MFKTVFDNYSWDEVNTSIQQKTTLDVERALFSTNRTLEDFKALLSPAALPYVTKMAQKSHALTTQRFGKTMQLFAPLYLSNECQNICTYCGFSMDLNLRRKTLTDEEIINEATILKQRGYEHILLVTGEAKKTVGVAYIKNALELLKKYFSQISIEVQPLDQDEYETLLQAGAYAVLVYQETYHKEVYKTYHPKGSKSNFDYRLDTPDRAGQAGMNKIGLGTLIGLEDWRTEAFFTALHLQFLEKTYWRSKYSISFPRLRPNEGNYNPNFLIKDKEFIQLISAWRLLNQEIELSLSTREEARFRDQLIYLGFTQMSIGSKTNPGGYSNDEQSLEQFEISDDRSIDEVTAVLKKAGYEPVWKDWHLCYNP